MANLKQLLVNGVSRFIGKVYIDDSHITTINGVAVTENPKFTDTIYTLPLATNGTRGGVQIGFTQSGKNYPVQLDNEKMYVNVPWTDNNTTYTIATGDSNGQIKVTPSSGSAYNVNVKGLGSAAYVNTTLFPVISTYDLPAAKAVRIKYPTYVPVLISAQRANSGGRLILLGGGYGSEGTIRNDFQEVVSSNQGSFTWCLPSSSSISNSIEIMNVNTSGVATITVWSSAAATFTEIDALSDAAMNKIIITSANYTNYTVTKTGSGASGTWGISISGSAAKVNNHTVNADVPANAVFTDTTYTFDGTYNASTNKAATVSTVTSAINALDGGTIGTPSASKTLTALSETNGNISATFGDISITKSQVSDFSHAHGNIQNGGTLQTDDVAIANGDKLVVTDASDSNKVARTSVSFDGSTATKALTQKGTWESFTNNTGTVTSVATGAGLTGGIITGSGTIKADLKSETKSTLTAASKGSTANREYAVGLDANGDLSVNIPWENTQTVTGVKGSNESSYRTGDVSISAANIGLGNVENKSSATIRGELTSANVTNALGYTPYNSTNPNGYTTNTGTVTSVQVQAISPVESSSSSASSTTLNTTISLANGYGDTQNPYGSKDEKQVLATPNNESGAPSFRNLLTSDIFPLQKKVYTDVIGTADNWAGATFFFASIRPTTWDEVWEIKYRIRTYVPNMAGYDQFADVLITGYRDALKNYYSNNTINTSVAYYHNLYRLKQAGYNNGYGHLLGISLRSTNYPTNTNYKRTIEIELCQIRGCTVTFLDNCIKYADAAGTGPTNYNTYSEINYISTGLQECSDSNDANYQNRAYYALRKTYTSMPRYQMAYTMKDAAYVFPTTTISNNVATLKTFNTTNPFDPFGEIYYYSSTALKDANTVLGDGTLYRQILCDLRYTFNIIYSFQNNIAYAVGDYVIYGEALYKCTTAHPAANWNASHFTVQAPKFATNTAYSVNSYVMYNYVLYKCTTAHAAGAWDASHFTRVSRIEGHNILLVARMPVYLVAVPQSDGSAVLHSDPITQDLPQSADNLIYIYLGNTYPDTVPYRVDLTLNHPVYEYKNGAIRQWINAAVDAVTVNGHTVNSDVPANAVFTDTWKALSTSQAGYVAQAPNDTNKFLRGDATWATVTKANVGLSEVENTKLSTWTGSSNITTVGTITTGTWNGTTIAVNKGGTGATSFTSGALLIGNGSNAIGTRTIKNMTAKGNLGWTGAGTDIYIPTVNTLAYWDGRYKDGSSNLTYCVKGEFGDASIKGVDNTLSAGTSSTNLPTSKAIDTYVSNTYLKLSGGTVTGTVNFNGIINASNSTNITGELTASNKIKFQRNVLPNITSVPLNGEIVLTALGYKTGYPVFTDPTFLSGTNSVNLYNNSASTAPYTSVTRMTYTDAGIINSGMGSDYVIRIQNTGSGTSPNLGGFYQEMVSRPNAILIQIFRALIPEGYTLALAANALGASPSDTWVTDNKGTGKWEWYARRVLCGSTGSFSSGGHVSLSGTAGTTDNPVTWYLGYCNCYDITKAHYDGLRTRFADSADSASSVAWSNVTDKPSTIVTSIALSGSNGISITGSPITSSGTITVGLNLSTAIHELGVGASTATRNDYIVAQYSGGNSSNNNTYYRRSLSNIFAALNNSDITSALGYTPVNKAGDTLSGGITFLGNQSSAWNDKGIIFTKGSRIGENTSGGLGIYAADILYLRPSSGTAANSSDGVEISSQGLYPSSNDSESLGLSTKKWANVYATYFNGALKGNADTATTATDAKYLITEGDNRSVATTPNDYANRIKFRGLKTNSYINSPSSDAYSYLIGLRGWADNNGGNAYEIAFNNTGIFVRKGGTTTWDSWSKLATVAANDDCVTLTTTQTITGAKTFTTGITYQEGINSVGNAVVQYDDTLKAIKFIFN